MPLLPSSYKAPLWIPGGHAETIIPNLFRSVEGIHYTRERIATQDGDFIDLDWSCKGHARLAILAHGLEGNTERPYMLGMVKTLNAAGWDTLSWNFRSCSGESNKVAQLYHAGSSEDLSCVIAYALKTGLYKEIILIGFSLGGNIILKYLSEQNSHLPSPLTKAVVFSVPGDLLLCVQELGLMENRIYLNLFLETLKVKLMEKAKLFPHLLQGVDPSHIANLFEFDKIFTAPLHGFKDVHHYYEECSAKNHIPNIRIPVLMINAQNDPFLNPACFPIHECIASSYVYLEAPLHGGHLGFMKKGINGIYWSEERTLDFLEAS